MVTFRSWLESTLTNNYSLLKVRVGNISYSFPCDPSSEIYNSESKTFTLKNSVTKTFMSWAENVVFNVEVFSMGDLNGSKLMMDKYISSGITPMLYLDLQNISSEERSDLIFLEGMNVNFLKIMDFMKFNNPSDFSKVNFSGEESLNPDDNRHVIRENFSKIILNRMDFTISNMINLMGKNESLSICEDLRKNVDDFLLSTGDIPNEKLKDYWPSLLNPSPFYFLPKKIYNDG